MARCMKCGAENEATNRFCASCGAKFVAVAPAVTAGEDGLYYCYKHKKETTRLTCGRCDRPICTRCARVGANGVRCPDCARNRIPVRVGGVLHDMSSSVGRTASNLGTRPIWYLWIWGMIIRFIMGFFGR